MKSLIRRNLLILMLGVTAATLSFSAPAFAKDGHSGSDSSSDDSGSSGSGSDSDSDSDDDSSGGGSDSDDDNSGSGGSDDGPGHDSGDDSNDDNSDDDNGGQNDDSSDDSSPSSGGGGRQRPTATLSLDAASLAGVRNGSLVVVDNLGRVLEVEFDRVNGRQVVTGKPHGGDARRNPGPIASVRVIPASQAPVHQ